MVRQWWAFFSKPCPYGVHTLAGAALAAIAAGCVLLMVLACTQGWKKTVALFPEPVWRAAQSLEAFWDARQSPPLQSSQVLQPSLAPQVPLPSKSLSFGETVRRIWRGGTERIVRAPLQNDALPYMELPFAPLTEAVKQVDYALTQAVLRLGMGLNAFQLISLERRADPKEHTPYMFQRLRLYVPQTEVAAGMEQLRQTVSVWCEAATLGAPSSLQLNIAVDGVPTHEVFVSPLVRPASSPPSFLARPETSPSLTIVIDDMGANLEAAKQLLDLGFPLTFSVWPRSAHAAKVAEAAWQAGQEVLVHQPCEPYEYPMMQPGPGAVFVRMPPEEIKKVVQENVRRVPYAVGLNNHMGSRVTANPAVARALTEAAAESGLFVLDSVTHPSSTLAAVAREAGVSAYRRSVFLDDPLSAQAIRAALRTAERLALAHGQAIAIGHPHPETIAVLREWSSSRDRSIQLVPLRMQRSYSNSK